MLRGRSVLSLAAGARMAVARPRQTIMVIHVATDTAAGTVDNPAALPPHLRVLGCPAHDTDKDSWWPMGCDGTAIDRARLKLIDRRPTATGAIPVALATFYRRWFIENFKRDVLGVASRRRRLKTRCKSEEAARIGRYGPWDCSDGPTRAAIAI